MTMYNVAEVIQHYPPMPSEANDLSFLIRWERYPKEKDYTWEHWYNNETLRINSIVLTYMNRLPHLRQYVPRDVIFSNSARMKGKTPSA